MFAPLTSLTPDALVQYARKLRETGSGNPNGVNPHPGMGGGGAGPSGSGGGGGMMNGGMFDGVNGIVPTTPSVTLYSGTPSTPGTQPTAAPTPQNGGSPPDGSKQNKSGPSSQTQGSSTPTSGPTSASTPAAATPTALTNTPSMANATLKRKANPGGDVTSPTTSNPDQAPPSKRQTRKRGRTQGGG